MCRRLVWSKTHWRFVLEGRDWCSETWTPTQRRSLAHFECLSSFPPAWPAPTLPNTSLVLCAGSRWQPYSEAESVRNRAMENRVASKLAFYSSGMAEASRGMNSSLIHIILSAFSQEFVFWHIFLLSSQWREGGHRVGGPFQQEGTRILFHNNCLFPWASSVCCRSRYVLPWREAREHGCRVDFSRTVSARLTHAVLPRPSWDLGKGWDQEEGVGLLKAVQDGTVTGSGRGKTFPFCCFKVCWSFCLIICLSILKISVYFHDIYQKQAPDYPTKSTLTLPYCYSNQNM